MDPIKTGKFIQELRKAKKFTQNDLADLLQVTNKAVSRWETGEGFPDVVLLPRLSEVLSVSIDDILKGERIEKIARHHYLEKQKLQNVYKICLAIISLSFVLFIGLTYTTFKAWIGFMSYVIPSTLALVWIQIARSNYMTACEYDDEDQKALFDTLRTPVILYAVLFAIILPQVIGIISEFSYHIIPFQYFILISFITGGLAFFSGSWYFSRIDKNLDNRPTPIYKKCAIYFTLILITILSIFLLSPLDDMFSTANVNIISVVYVSFLVYIFFSLSYLIRKEDNIIIFFLRVMIIVAMVFVSTFGLFYEGDSSFLRALPIVIYFSVLLLSIAGFIWKFVHYRKDSLFRLYFQNIFLLVYFFFYIFGLIVPIIIIITFGTFDVLINKKIDSKTSLYLNENQDSHL